MSASSKIVWTCAGIVIHVAVFLTVAVALFIFAWLQPDISTVSAGLRRLEYVWTLIWSWRGKRFMLLLLANVVCLPAFVGGWSTFSMLMDRRNAGSVGCLAGFCAIATYPFFVIGTAILIATADFRIGTVASWNFPALFIYVGILDILFVPLTVLSHCIVRNMIRRTDSSVVLRAARPLSVALICFVLSGFFAWGFYDRYWQWRDCIAQAQFFCQIEGAASADNRYWAAFGAFFLLLGFVLLSALRRPR